MQVMGVPFRHGGREVMMVTTAKGRWTFPKGLVERELTLEEACAKEVLEEGGVEGELRGAGASFRYVKDDWGGPDGVVCEVHLFTLDVTVTYEQGDARWPDDGEGSLEFRKRKWFYTAAIAEAVASTMATIAAKGDGKGKKGEKGKAAKPPFKVAKAAANQAVLDLLVAMTT